MGNNGFKNVVSLFRDSQVCWECCKVILRLVNSWVKLCYSHLENILFISNAFIQPSRLFCSIFADFIKKKDNRFKTLPSDIKSLSSLRKKKKKYLYESKIVPACENRERNWTRERERERKKRKEMTKGINYPYLYYDWREIHQWTYSNTHKPLSVLRPVAKWQHRAWEWQGSVRNHIFAKMKRWT